MNVQMKVEGLDTVRRIAAQSPRVLDSELRKSVRDSAVIVRSQAVANARRFSSTFPSSIRYRISGLEATVGSLAKSALSIEQGRRPGEIVKRGLIRRWIERRGLVRGIFNIESQRLQRRLGTRRRQDAEAEERRLAAVIVEQIRRSGTKPLAYLIPAAQAQKDNVTRYFKRAVDNTLRRVAR